MSTNMGTALILMGTGDITAQMIENHSMETEEIVPSRKRQRKEERKPENPKLHFRRYGTLSPDIEKIHREQRLRRLTYSRREEYNFGQEHVPPLSQLREGVRLASIDLFLEIKSLDAFRTGTMVAWSVFAYTPFFIVLYKLFDRYLPTKVTMFSVSARTGLSFLVSIPVNAAFFCYGCFVHHIAEWATLLQELHYATPDSSVSNLLVNVPFDFEMAWSTARLKLEKELYTTIAASAGLWVPVNFFNFSVVPPHLRPLTLVSY